uniref:TSC22 domain family, member 2 n=2 Tax=Oryzias latipes TaxID=8090 RepID=A0A3B3HM91_ORYLA
MISKLVLLVSILSKVSEKRLKEIGLIVAFFPLFSCSASGTNIVAIDNKIEQAMDLVKSHLMYAVREEVEVLKEQIKELYERNSVLERENAVLKSLANSEQLSQLATQSAAGSGAAPLQQVLSHPQPLPQPPIPQQPQPQLDSGQQPQPNVTSA